VVALLDNGGNVLTQYAYEPYGEVIAEDRIGWLIPKNGVGHQGLFFERFDAPLSYRQLAVGGFGIYHNRNRSYSPYLGRYLQRDPYTAGIPTLADTFVLGSPLRADLRVFEGSEHYGQGMNLYAYEGAHPNGRVDPLGGRWIPSLFDVSATVGGFIGFYDRMYDLAPYGYLPPNFGSSAVSMVARVFAIKLMASVLESPPGSEIVLNHPVAGVLGGAIGYYIGVLSAEMVATAIDMGGGGGFDAIDSTIDWILGW